MQISNRQVDSVFRAVASQTRPNNAQRAKRGNEITPTGDKAVISSRALELSKYKEVLARTPDVREDKIVALAERIKSGEYHPPAEQVAEKMMLRSIADRLE